MNIGDKVIKNEETWISNEFDDWGRGIGVGLVVDIVDDSEVDVRWDGGRCYESINQLIKLNNNI